MFGKSKGGASGQTPKTDAEIRAERLAEMRDEEQAKADRDARLIEGEDRRRAVVDGVRKALTWSPLGMAASAVVKANIKREDDKKRLGQIYVAKEKRDANRAEAERRAAATRAIEDEIKAHRRPPMADAPLPVLPPGVGLRLDLFAQPVDIPAGSGVLDWAQRCAANLTTRENVGYMFNFQTDVDPATVLDRVAGHAVEVLYMSAVRERMKRGYNVIDPTGRVIAPEVGPYGAPVVEVLESGGGRRIIIGDDIKEPLAPMWWFGELRFNPLYSDAAARRGEITADDLRRYQAAMTDLDGLKAAGLWPLKGSYSLGLPTYENAVMPWTLSLTEVAQEAPRNLNPFAPPSTLHGDAAFAWVDDLDASRAVRSMMKAPRDATGGVLGEFSTAAWVPKDHPHHGAGAALSTTGEGHRLVIGPPGSGKFTAVIAPSLLTTDAASFVVFDVKNGEAAKLTAAHRAKRGPVLVLDPFGITGHPSGALNPLDLLRADDPRLNETANRLVQALFVRSNDAKADYWDAQASEWLAAFLIHVATSPGEEGQRTLKRVREIIRRPIDADLIDAMDNNPAAGGVVRDTAANIVHAQEADGGKNLFYVQQTLRANTSFLDLPTVQEITSHTTFSPALLRERVATLYVVIPESDLQTVGRWLRLVYSMILEGVKSEGVPLHIVIDEFPSLGSFARVADDMARTRFLGIRMNIIVQSLSQLQAIYGNSWERFTANAKFLQVLGANDHMTQDYVSKRLGRTTARATSESHGRDAGAESAKGTNTSFIGVDLMAPDQVGRLPAHETLVLVEGERPWRLNKMNYYEWPSLLNIVETAKA